jgi:hypothetical protein
MLTTLVLVLDDVSTVIEKKLLPYFQFNTKSENKIHINFYITGFINKEKYASSTYEYEFFDNTLEEIHFSIYLM